MNEEFSKDLWLIEGEKRRFLGIPFDTRMVVIRLVNGSLWVNSPVSIDDQTRKQVASLGEVKYLISPNKLHAHRLREWSNQNPDAEIWVSPDSVKREPWLEGEANPLIREGVVPWENEIEQTPFEGSVFLDEVVFFHKKSKTLILADLIQSHRGEEEASIWKFGKWIMGVLAPRAGTPLDLRLTFFHRREARATYDRIMSWDFQNLVIAHGRCWKGNGRDVVRNAFSWLR